MSKSRVKINETLTWAKGHISVVKYLPNYNYQPTLNQGQIDQCPKIHRTETTHVP